MAFRRGRNGETAVLRVPDRAWPWSITSNGCACGLAGMTLAACDPGKVTMTVKQWRMALRVRRNVRRSAQARRGLPVPVLARARARAELLRGQAAQVMAARGAARAAGRVNSRTGWAGVSQSAQAGATTAAARAERRAAARVCREGSTLAREDQARRAAARADYAKRAARVGSWEWVESVVDSVARNGAARARGRRVSDTSRDEAWLAARRMVLLWLRRDVDWDGVPFKLYSIMEDSGHGLRRLAAHTATRSLDDCGGFVGQQSGARSANVRMLGGDAGMMLAASVAADETSKANDARSDYVRQAARALARWRVSFVGRTAPQGRVAAARRARRVSRWLLAAWAGRPVKECLSCSGFGGVKAARMAVDDCGVRVWLCGSFGAPTVRDGWRPQDHAIDWVAVRRAELAKRRERGERGGVKLPCLPGAKSIRQLRADARAEQAGTHDGRRAWTTRQRLGQRADYVRAWKRLLA